MESTAMLRSIARTSSSALLLLCLSLNLGMSAARADDGDEIEKLWEQILALKEAGKERDVLPVAQRMLKLAERSYADQPTVLGPCLEFVAGAYEDRDQIAEAETRFQKLLAYREKELGPDHADVARTLKDLSRIAQHQGRLAEAEVLAKRALDINAKHPGKDSEDYSGSLNRLASLSLAQGRFADSESYFLQCLELEKKLYGPESMDAAKMLHNYAVMLSDWGRYADAEKQGRLALAIMEKQLGPDHPVLANSLNSLGGLAQIRGDFAEAERLIRRAMELRKRALGPESTAYAHSLNNLGNLHLRLNRFAEAKDFYERSVAIQEKALGPNHPEVADALNNFGSFHHSLARMPEAEQLFRRSLAIREAAYGPQHEAVAQALHNLGACAADLGRLADAEAFYKRALAIREKVLGPNHTELALTITNLANTLRAQGRKEEAEPLLLQALEIRRKALGDESPVVADSWSILSSFYLEDGRVEEAEDLARKVLAVRQKTLGDDNVETIGALSDLGRVFVEQNRYAEAQQSFQQGLDALEKTFGPDHPQVAFGLNELANLHFEQDQFAAAEPFLDRAIQILERAQAHPAIQFWQYDTRAQIAWKDGRKSEAIADLRRAMDLAEQIRSQTSGAAHERATGFAQYAKCFERMLNFQLELGDVTEALAAIERARARGLLDDMNAAGLDLLAGRSSAERAALQEQELQLKSRIAQIEEEARAAPPEKRSQIEGLASDARAALYEFYRDQRSTSPVYRNLLSVGATPLRLRQLQRSLADNSGVMLIYYIGEDAGYLLTVLGDAAQLHKLELSAEQAELLGVDAGPLTQKRIEQIISGTDTLPGVVSQLANSRDATPPLEALHVLWQTLIPPTIREQLVAAKFQRLIVIPDGPLALLPFETLVVETSPQPKYLLDVGPPTMYAPSATVFINLATTPKDPSRQTQEPLLTVADPAYQRGAKPKQVTKKPQPKPDTVASLSAGSRYAGSGGDLAPLPFSAQEARWLMQNFQKHDQSSISLLGAQATEAAVRQKLAGHPIIHFACHGLTDQRYGNFFGALAFTPGQTNDPADDGFLTLPEIYELDLKDCELAILSACQTNYGPQQQGEGVWTLSRGFLVAGTRRVVASNWLVDDEAAASLISYFASGFAAQRQSGQADYATALHAAKRWVRQQDKWSSPYFWGTFELIGPQ
jgi:CHAT domain-containing protein/Tfp pilus assembly protein PilF